MNSNIHTTNASPALVSAVSDFLIRDIACTLGAAPVATLQSQEKTSAHLMSVGFGEAIVATLGQYARKAALTAVLGGVA